MYTKQLAQFARTLSYQDLSPQAVELGKLCVEDLIGVALAGSVSPQGNIWRSCFASGNQPAEAAAWTPGFPCIAYPQAAALNAAWGHLLDLDDVHNRSIVHLGVVTIPAALAVGSALHRSGRDVLAAVAAGYEVGARVGEALNPESYYYWHTTGVVGALATAAVCGKLLDLDEVCYQNALGSAGTQAAGLWEFLEDGAMSKSLHTANAALCGIRSARLAALGLTGASRILEGERGLLHALVAEPHLEALVQGLDPLRLKIQEISFKSYACCRHTHGANAAMANLIVQHQLQPEDIVQIVDRTYATAKQTVDNSHPATPYACKFSVQYCIAALLLGSTLMEDAFAEPFVSDFRLSPLMERISVVVDPVLESEYQADPSCWPHILEVVLQNGQVLRERVYYPPGDVHAPFDRARINQKFYDVTRPHLHRTQAEALCRRIHHLDELEDISRLFERWALLF